MSIQVAVRLADSLVEFIDAEVANGHAASRAALVTRALEREHRRVLAARDAAILASSEDDGDLGAVAAHLHRRPLDID